MYLSVLPLSLGIASIAASPLWWSVRPRASRHAIKPVCETRHLTLSIACKHQARHGRLQGELAWRAGVQDRRRHLSIAPAATSEDMLMRMMALALGTFLRDTQPATHHGEPRNSEGRVLR
jgi:hypothetical protein